MISFLFFIHFFSCVCGDLQFHPLHGGKTEVVIPQLSERTLECTGIELFQKDQWDELQNLSHIWLDVDLSTSRTAFYWLRVLIHNDMLVEAAQDCGFGLLVMILSSIRAADYDYTQETLSGKTAGQALYEIGKSLIEQLKPYMWRDEAEVWRNLEENLEDLQIYPWLLGMEEEYDCGMEDLKIFVYDDRPDLTKGPLHCHHGQWGVETLIPHWIKHSSCATTDPDEADYFFVPWYTWCQRMVIPLNRTAGEISAYYLEMTKEKDLLTGTLPNLKYWNYKVRNGADHIFLFSDQGLNFFPEYENYIQHSIFLTTEAFTPDCGRPCFDPWKDIVIPGHTDFFRGRRMLAKNKPDVKDRNFVFNFHGRHPFIPESLGRKNYEANHVRRALMENFGFEINANVPHDVSVGGFIEEYFEIMGDSRFCVIPHGNTSWTNHLYEAFYTGCVPVIMSDNFEVPFEEVVDYRNFTMKWSQENITTDVYHSLKSIALKEVEKMHDAVEENRCWFNYHERRNVECSPYRGVMEILKRRKVRLPPYPKENFWGPLDYRSFLG